MVRRAVGQDPVWHPTVLTKDRDRLLEGAVADEFFSLVVQQAREKKSLSDEHFTVDGTLIEAWAGHKSFQRNQGSDDKLNPLPTDPGSSPTSTGGKRNEPTTVISRLRTHLRGLFKKAGGTEAKLAYLRHVLMGNRNGLVVNVRLTEATGTAERDAALAMLHGKTACK